MKLNPHVQFIADIPNHMMEYLKEVCKSIDLDDPLSLTKEEAFFDSCNRYDAETEFFNTKNNFYSGVLPSSELALQLQPYYEYLFDQDQFKDCMIFRSQIVRNIPGTVVKPHIDLRLYHKLSHRVHAVLATNDHARHVYYNDNYEMEFHKMEFGKLYDFDNLTPHSVFNLGSSSRLHVITDVMPLKDFRIYRASLAINPNRIAYQAEEAYKFHVSKINAKYPDLIGEYKQMLNI